jgi:hypothetical protein
MGGSPFGYEPDEDERYHFKGYDPELLRALGRLTLNASYLESVLVTMLARLVDNSDLELGDRLAADSGFRALVDHVRAVSEYRLPAELHATMLDWLNRATKAYAARNRFVHSHHGLQAEPDGRMFVIWIRATARGKSYVSEIVPATADEVHATARTLEALGLEGVHLMTPVQDAVHRT